MADAAAPHLRRRLDRGAQPFNDWELFLAPLPAERLVVFVHGYRGRASSTWGRFAPPPPVPGDFWQRSDLVFAQYDSLNEHLTAASDHIRQGVEWFYGNAADCDGVGTLVTRAEGSSYAELVLVGHSLGGVVIRQAIMETASAVDRGDSTFEALLSARLVLFSPATAGFLPSGGLGALYDLHGIRGFVRPLLARAPMFSDLISNSRALQELEAGTVALARRASPDQRPALRPFTVHSATDKVIDTRVYETDRSAQQAREANHRSICKPTRHDERPRAFVEEPDRRVWSMT